MRTIGRDLAEPPIKPDAVGNGSAYKVLNALPKRSTRAGSNIYALSIGEYYEKPLKAFVFLDNDVVYLATANTPKESRRKLRKSISEWPEITNVDQRPTGALPFPHFGGTDHCHRILAR